MSAAIGLLGLVISFSVFIILMAQVWYDVSFDRSWPGSSRIYTFERPQDYLGEPNPFKALFPRIRCRKWEYFFTFPFHVK